jgi:Flp pilus assembly protein TadG
MRFASKRRRGSIVILVAICLIALLGIVALALDGGVLLDQRRHVQAAADALALLPRMTFTRDIRPTKARTLEAPPRQVHC